MGPVTVTERADIVEDVFIVSFGYLHGDPPGADITLDLREVLRDPHVSPEMRELTGLSTVVQDHVMNTPGAVPITKKLCNLVRAYLPPKLDAGNKVSVAVGCGGGRHRSVVIANWLADYLRMHGVQSSVSHRDMHRPVVKVQPCECVTDCADHPPTRCSLSGQPHVHPDLGRCPAHPDAPGDWARDQT
jgi:RNase adaptor protein for sRNA GlmZ degradation